MSLQQLSLTALIALSSSVYAAPYISFAVGQGDGNDWTSAINPSQTISSVSQANKETAFTAAVGTLFGSILGAEINYTNLGKYTAEGIEGDLKAIGISAVAQLKLGSLALFAKAGGAHISATSVATINSNNAQQVVKDELSKVSPSYGAGLEYQITPSIGLFSDYQVFTVDAKNAQTGLTENSNVKTTNAGVRIRF